MDVFKKNILDYQLQGEQQLLTLWDFQFLHHLEGQQLLLTWVNSCIRDTSPTDSTTGYSTAAAESNDDDNDDDHNDDCDDDCDDDHDCYCDDGDNNIGDYMMMLMMYVS